MEPTGLRGRERHCAALEQLVEAVRSGEGRALVLRGEPGVGKSALLGHLAQVATGFRPLRAVGVESEMVLPFAGLHQLCAPLLDGLDRLPAPQRAALATAFGLSDGPAPDRFLVSLAALSLLGEAAERQPLLCLVDDAQWVDRTSAQVLAFVARRLLAEPVGVVFSVRDTPADLVGLPELLVEGLDHGDAWALLDSVVAGRLDRRIGDRIIDETRGNPLALLELPRSWTPAELTSGLALADAAPLSTHIERSFLRRVAQMPADTQRLLLVAAADPIGDPALLWRAAARLDLDPEAVLRPAGDLITVDARVRFRHPLVRSAVYRVATPEERRRAHATLVPAELDPDRRTWHRAHAADGPDEAVSAALEASAERAQARGSLVAAVAFLERAVQLTPDAGRRAARALKGARAAHAAGASESAPALLELAREGPLDVLEQARCGLLEAQIAFTSSRGRGVASRLVAAAQRLEPHDPALARTGYRQAFWAACFAGHLADPSGTLDVALAVRAASARPAPRPPADLMLDGLATRIVDGYRAGAPEMQAALRTFRTALPDGRFDLAWVWLAVDLFDADAWLELGTRQVQVTREAGGLTMLPLALHTLSAWHEHAGELSVCESLLDEADAILAAVGQAPMTHARLGLEALRGGDVPALIDASISDATDRGEGILVRHAEHAAARLYNGLGRHDEALRWARSEHEHNPHVFYMTALPELVEAAVRCGEEDLAWRALEPLRERAHAGATPWARGVEARARALLSDGDEAEVLYRRAIALLTDSRLRVEATRAQLLYGEWLRGEGRRRDARHELHSAQERFTAMGATVFAERAARELQAIGGAARGRDERAGERLTGQEAQIARLARDGLSNAQIGGQLFISPRTVEYHLHKVFAKLGVASRDQLAGPLADEPGAA